MDAARAGVLAGVAAYGIWGLFPLYWPLLEPTGPVEVLAHRVVWSLVVVTLLLALRGRAGRGGLERVVAVVRRPRTLALVALGGFVVSLNWGVYIYAVTSDRVIDAALGYFVNPLVTVLLGVLVLGERLRRLQWVAVGLAAVAVVVLAVGYGQPPVIALVLAGSFGAYGLLKKTTGVGALEGLVVETAAVAPLALTFLAVLQVRGDAALQTAPPGLVALLVGSGVVTAVPLLLFGAAARRIPLSTVGLLQYLTPTLQLLLGLVVFHEPMPPARLAGFLLVWVALLLFAADSFARQRAARLVARTAPAS